MKVPKFLVWSMPGWSKENDGKGDGPKYVTFNKTSMLCIVVGVLNAILPMQDINIAIFGSYEEHLDDRSFEEIDAKKVGGFGEDYDRCNPVTRDVAMRNYRNNSQLRRSGF